MAKTPVSDEELQLRKRARRRLVGAIVLVLLVVVLVPMFLEHEPRQQKQDMDIRIPAIPGQSQEGRPGPNAGPVSTPVTPPPSGTASSAMSSGAAAPAPATAETPALDVLPPETKTAVPAKPPAAKPAATEAAKSVSEEGFVIQLGAYSNASNARQLLRQLRAHKFPGYSEPLKTPRGEKTRVRVGPYPSVEVAEKARERLKAMKLMPVSDAKVVRTGE